MAPISHIEQLVRSAIEQHTQPRDNSVFSLAEAQHLGALVEQEALAIKVPVVFSAVNASGCPIFFFHMDGALLVSNELAVDKAYTAAALKMPTHELARLMRKGGALEGLQYKSRITGVGGGYPYFHNGILVGGVAVSGGTVDQDIQIITRALQKIVSKK